MRNVRGDGKPQWQPDGVLEREVELEGLRHCGPYLARTVLLSVALMRTMALLA